MTQGSINGHRTDRASDSAVRLVSDGSKIGHLAVMAAPKTDLVDELLRANAIQLRKFSRNPLFALVHCGELDLNDRACAQFLACFQVWSDAFQRMGLERAALGDLSGSWAVTVAHLAEEFGHNAALPNVERGRRWDPVLEATTDWFVHKMRTLDGSERIVLMHLVVEASAEVFHEHFGPPRRGIRKTTVHFDKHESAIGGHVKTGLEVLRGRSTQNASDLLDVLHQGWEMLNTMFRRIAELVQTRRFFLG